MATQTPLILLDNLFDAVVQYPAATVSADTEAAGREAFHVADYRRDRTWWSPTAAAAGHYVQVDLGSVITASPDYLYLDRGHNLWGKTIEIRNSAVGTQPFGTTSISRGIPALDASGNFVPGGDPSTGVCVTEEGACYLFFAGGAVKRYWQLYIVDNMLPIVPGVQMGVRSQLFGYSDVYDDDEATRKVRSEESDAGYLATGRATPTGRRSSTSRSSAIPITTGSCGRSSQLIFQRDAPWVLCLNWGLYPARDVDVQVGRHPARDGEARRVPQHQDHGSRSRPAGAMRSR
jgi:hypothetical protein